ncbi:DNA-binding transcriptional regulator, LysR family [Tistlia consotensis]|uniref:DNA-binding transcriptional regulator, LysR family n=1 Tax=Tistlia consotensis USBA 355 TaxID=560819 RepID=A0A1Y6CI66_9PROT|nr:LysR substrate-binding domain-containing protein [Tistlia consotensis]SMF57008.1 DNA-binding transcriptional regulator, LysR family [Tistlia consotensis USBA 355]SNR45220.1 DNA-binding transcriptional regulator, LysR family [Tistlia consotensis]
MKDLNDLAFFAAVVSHGGLSPAARALGLPKSRLSRRLAALEAELGLRLVERTTRRFNVTEAGRDVFDHARAALAEAEAVDAVAARLRAEPQGLVRVSCPLGAELPLAAALPAFLARHPRLRVQLLQTNRRVDLIDERVDLAIRVRERLEGDADLQLRILGSTRSLLAASPALLAERGRPESPAKLAALPTLSRTEQPGPDRWTLAGPAGARETLVHEPRFAAGTFAVVRDAAIAGLGVALLPEMTCRQPFADGTLERVLPDWSGEAGVLHLVFTSRRGLLPGVRAVIDFVAETLGGCSRDALPPA